MICPDCGHKIDPDLCYCGQPRVGHDGSKPGPHTFVPQGCQCVTMRVLDLEKPDL